MARTNNLTNFLTDVAAAIKSKLEDSTSIPAYQFDTKIMDITTGGNYQAKSITIQTNGNYTLNPDTGYDAMNSVSIIVSVPSQEPVLQTKSIIENGTYTPDEGYDGFSQVNVNVPENVLIFNDIESMEQDSRTANRLQGKLAMSYVDNWLPTSGNHTIVNTIKLPQTVTLTEEVTTTITGTYYRNSGSLVYDYSIELTPTKYKAWRDRSAGVIAEYTSADGITYTRTSTNNEFQFDVRNGWDAVWDNDILNNFCLSHQLYVSSTGIWNNIDLLPIRNKPIYNETNDNITWTDYYKYDNFDDLAEFLFSTVFPDIGITFGSSKRYIPIEELSHNVFKIYYSAIANNSSYVKIKNNTTMCISYRYTDSSVYVITVDMNTNTWTYTTEATVNKDYALYTIKDITENTHFGIYGLWRDRTQRNNHYFDIESVTFYHNNAVVIGTINLPVFGWNIVDTTRYNAKMRTTIPDTTADLSKYIVEVPVLDTSSIRNMNSLFYGCSALTEVPPLNTSSVTTMNSTFYGCSSLTSIPLLATSNVTSMSNVFKNCTSLTDVPAFDTSALINMTNMFSGCTNLSNSSLNNILAMCINATSFSGVKTLQTLGLTSTQATTCQSLSHYQAFLDAGWTTGY